MRRRWLAVPCALVFTACDPPQMISERGEFRLSVDGLSKSGSAVDGTWWAPPYLVLADTRLCPELLCDACEAADGCEDAALQASGPVSVDDDGCFVTEAPGEVVWTVASGCGAPGQPPDQIRMRVLAADEVEARAYPWLDGTVAQEAPREQPGILTIGAPWPGLMPREFKVVAGEQVELIVELFEPGSGHPVARQAEPAAVTWTTTRGRPAVTYPAESLRLVSFAGTESAAAFEFAGHTWPIGQLTGVPAESVVSLELAGALIVSGDPDAPLLGRTSTPLGARAIARDAAGDLVIGLPMAWSADVGNVAHVPELTRHEHLVVADDCVAPEQREGPRALVLRGSSQGLSATLRFDWTGTREATVFTPEPGADWAPSPNCLEPTGGCGCRSADPGGASLLLLGLLGLRRRRRSRTCPSGHAFKNMAIGTCLCVLPLVACSGDPPALAVAEALPLGELPLGFSPAEGGHSVGVGERALWVFRDTRRGGHYESASTAAVLADADAVDGLFPFSQVALAEDGTSLPLLRLREGETAATVGPDDAECAAADACPYVSLWPGPVVHDPERARVLVFYRKVAQARGAADRHVGSSIAVWRDDLAGRPVRPALAEDPEEPTLLFGADGPRLAAAAIADDEFVFAFACDGKDNPCVLLRAPLDRALERDAWRFLAEDGAWSGSRDGAQELFAGAPTMSVHRSAHADAYVAVYAEPGDAAVVLRTAPRLEGPWSDAADLYRPDAPLGPLRVRDALLHRELAREGGLVEYLTYAEDEVGGDMGRLQLVEVRWQ